MLDIQTPFFQGMLLSSNSTNTETPQHTNTYNNAGFSLVWKMPYRSKYKDVHIPKCNILSYIFADAKGNSTKPTWIDANDPSRFISRDQVLVLLQRLAVGFDRLGVGEQEIIMVLSPNHIFVPLVYLAAAGSKRIFTGVNPAYTVGEIAYQMKAVAAAVVFIHPSLIEIGSAAAREANIPTNRLFLFADTESQTSEGLHDWRTLLAPETDATEWRWDPLAGDKALQTIAAINFSSGTTGLPKGVCVTHHNLVANTTQTTFNFFETTPYNEHNHPPERWLGFLPLYHAYSQLWTINIACRLQIPVFVMPKFTLEEFLKHVETFQITSLQAVPPVLTMLHKREETKRYNLSSLRHILCGAAPLSFELQNEVSKRFGIVISQGWGMTETTCVGMLMPGRVNDLTGKCVGINLSEVPNFAVVGSVGYLLPQTEAMLVSEDGDEITRDEIPGELWVRGPQIMLRYLNNEQATQDTKTEDGWLKTGDIAIVRKDKFFIVDRKKELIKVNGLQVAPAELEGILLENENIADAAVVGIALHGNELPRAYVVLQKAAEGVTVAKDIQDFVAARVARHKRLTGGVKLVAEVPKLASGKIIRRLVREWSKRDAQQMALEMQPKL